MSIPDHIKCVDVGNWYSEYECQKCHVKWVEDADAEYEEHDCPNVPEKLE